MPTAEELAKQILVQVNANMQESMKELHKELHKELRKDLLKEASQQVKRKFADTDESYEIKKKGNRAQFKTNKEILDCINDALENLNDNDLEKVKENLTKSKELINKRIKLIRIADREELGWEVVNCYMNDALASNADDEQNIIRARREAAANKRKEDLKKQKNRKRPNNYSVSNRYSRDEFQPERRSKICYLCGSENHLQYNCPRKPQYSSSRSGR